VTFRADPPILRKYESADVRCIKKARLSKHFGVARVIDCEGVRATLEAFARSAAQLRKRGPVERQVRPRPEPRHLEELEPEICM
jgi:hypothetical protein